MSTNILSLDRAIQNTISWLGDVQAELGWDSKDNTYKSTKAVMQTIRDRLTVEETVHFCANLPLVMKGMMMDGYNIANKPLKIRDLEEFYEQIQQNYDGTRRDIVNSSAAARAVIKVLCRRMGGGEMAKIGANMPEKIRRLFEEPDTIVADVPKELDILPHQ
jgi:uncharacterized protein (DUF2267 family)